MKENRKTGCQNFRRLSLSLLLHTSCSQGQPCFQTCKTQFDFEDSSDGAQTIKGLDAITPCTHWAIRAVDRINIYQEENSITALDRMLPFFPPVLRRLLCHSAAVLWRCKHCGEMAPSLDYARPVPDGHSLRKHRYPLKRSAPFPVPLSMPEPLGMD